MARYRQTTGGTARRVSASGYSDAGASWRKRSLKSFQAYSSGAREDIDANNYTLRQRSRMLYMASPVAASAIKTNRTNVIGCGLRLQARPKMEVLGLSPDTARAWQRKTEAEFELWAARKRSCDATGINDFYGIQQLALMSWLLSGDVFCVIKQAAPTPRSPYSLRLHLIEADRVSTPGTPGATLSNITEGIAKNGNKIYDGVEVDRGGAITAYYICNNYPNELKLQTNEWNRIEAYGAQTGLPNVLQIMDTERPEQYRGVSYLAQVIEPLLQMRRYTESELTAALIESFFTAFVKTENPEENPFNEAGEAEIRHSDDEYEMGPGQINYMKPGEDVIFGTPSRPNSRFEGFVRCLCEQVGAALEIPADLLLKSFNASYSASRAALLEAWKAFKMRRVWFVADFCKPVYEIWLSEAIARGRIQAPGYFTDPLVHEAWLGSEWVGPSQGQLDPTKEIEAEVLAVEHGFSTHEQSTIKLNGGQWEANVSQLVHENQKLRESAGTTDPAKEEMNEI
jgi:lambda family phage portal protein